MYRLLPCAFVLILAGCERPLGVPEEQHPPDVDPVVDSISVDPAARLVWTSTPEGGIGLGREISVGGDGAVALYHIRFGSEEVRKDDMPILEVNVGADRAAQLFSRWAAVDRARLPHYRPGRRCAVSVKPCTQCANQILEYEEANALAPELDDVWAWFDALVGDVPDRPYDYCRFHGT